MQHNKDQQEVKETEKIFTPISPQFHYLRPQMLPQSPRHIYLDFQLLNTIHNDTLSKSQTLP